MGSTSYITKPKAMGYRTKSGSSAGSDKDMNGKLKRTKIRRPTKMSEYGLKRIPDYTELAYKEAVSKLRYFLSGNYAPSVRSYGGSPSVKNLDESDGDIDKKYTSSYLTDYKPRPRLTTKYATLYADSLNNYTPQHTSAAPPPPTGTGNIGADITGGTNPDVIHFIQKQEEYIEQLERESQYCRDELNNLLGKVKEVISENEHLHEAQKNKLISRMFHSYNGSESDELDDLGDSTGLDSDNKVTSPKGRKPTKSRFTKLEGPNIVFESRIAELEAQLTQSNIDLKKIQDENNENKRKLASGLVDSTCLDGFKRQIDNLQRDKSSLEAQISKLKLSLEQRDDDNRYKRGSDVLENQLREERNNLETEIRRLKDELAKERSKIRELAGEGARRAIQERSAAEQRYNAHFDELQHDLAAQYDNVAKLQLDLERQRREENELKREISMKNAAIDELKMELKNKMSSLQADLAQAHAEKASLEEELASARLAMERHQRQAKHEANRLNSEIQSLRQRLDRADADLVHSRRENLRLSEQISNLEKEQTMKNLTPISPEKNKKEKELSTMLESMENKHAKTVAELESMIHSQNSLMEKLTGECRLLTDKLDDANRRHKQELASLQRQVNGLSISLQPPHTPITYEAHPPHATSSDRNLSRTSPDSGRDYTGVEPPGYTSAESVRPITTPPTDTRDNTYDAPGINEPTATKTEYETAAVTEEENIEELQNDYQKPANEHEEEQPEVEIKQEISNPMELEQTQAYDPQNYEYDQNFEQTVETGDTEYQNQYEHNPEQSEQENFEKYEQYTDPNAQYEQQYSDYPTETNYQGDQIYDTTQNPEEHHGNENPVQYNESDEMQQNYNTTQHAQEYEVDQNIRETQKEKVAEQNNSKKSQKLPSQS